MGRLGLKVRRLGSPRLVERHRDACSADELDDDRVALSNEDGGDERANEGAEKLARAAVRKGSEDPTGLDTRIREGSQDGPVEVKLNVVPYERDRGESGQLTDTSLDEFRRTDVSERLGDVRAAAAVPCLSNALQSDASGIVVASTIRSLEKQPYRVAVEALIAGLDANFDGKVASPVMYEPEMFRAAIAASLEALTGQRLGPAAQSWRTWWQRSGRAAFAEGQARPPRPPKPARARVW